MRLLSCLNRCVPPWLCKLRVGTWVYDIQHVQHVYESVRCLPQELFVLHVGYQFIVEKCDANTGHTAHQ